MRAVTSGRMISTTTSARLACCPCRASTQCRTRTVSRIPRCCYHTRRSTRCTARPTSTTRIGSASMSRAATIGRRRCRRAPTRCSILRSARHSSSPTPSGCKPAGCRTGSCGRAGPESATTRIPTSSRRSTAAALGEDGRPALPPIACQLRISSPNRPRARRSARISASCATG